MERLSKDGTGRGANRKSVLLWLGLLSLAATMMLSSCGSSGSSGVTEPTPTLSGNWQFTMAPQVDGNNQVQFLGGLQGGFTVQSDGTVTGAANYAVFIPQLPDPCNSGSAAIAGTVSGENVSFTAVAGTQTFTLMGTVSNVISPTTGLVVGETMAGSYTSTAGTSPDGSPCGIAETTGLQWSAVLVPPITGSLQGSFHSTGGPAGLSNQDFPLTGSITQGANTGASSATVSGTLSFLSPGTSESDYPCMASASLYGQISGNLVSLQIIGASESIIGKIGEPFGSNGVTGVNPVDFNSATGGYVLQGVGPSYLVATSACPGSTDSIFTAGDFGNLCLAVASTLGTQNACQEPIMLTPAPLIFAAQAEGTTLSETMTLANTSGGGLSGLTLAFANVPSSATNFTETDTCGAGGIPSQPGVPFNMASGGSCVITIAFTPSCTGQQCASATITVTSPVSADSDDVFSVPVVGTGISGQD